jgi:hypothetical protein
MVLPEAEERMARLLRLAQPEWTGDRASALARYFKMTWLPSAKVSETATLPSKWDEWDWPTISSRTVGAVRDMDYLTWRYLKHPVFEYRFIGVPHGKRTGLLIWRLETIHHATPNGIVKVDQIGRMVEFLPASSGNARQLLTAFTRELSKANALGADYYGYHGESLSIPASRCERRGYSERALGSRRSAGVYLRS